MAGIIKRALHCSFPDLRWVLFLQTDIGAITTGIIGTVMAILEAILGIGIIIGTITGTAIGITVGTITGTSTIIINTGVTETMKDGMTTEVEARAVVSSLAQEAEDTEDVEAGTAEDMEATAAGIAEHFESI